jgi:RsmE family RNA methyltransferase
MFSWTEPPRPADPIALIVGMPRPQTARDILRDATTLGVERIDFVRTEKSDANYAQSTLWSSGEWRRHLITGAEQAFDTRIPEVTFTRRLQDAIRDLHTTSLKVALDNYEAPNRLGDLTVAPASHCVVAIGGERGWSSADRTLLRAQQFTFVHLGSRVLRTETAAVAALSILRMKRGLM